MDLYLVGTVDLGLTREAWGKLTPRVLLLMWKRREMVERRKDRRAFTVAAILVNVNRKKGAPAIDWSDFAPDPFAEKPRGGLVAQMRDRSLRPN